MRGTDGERRVKRENAAKNTHEENASRMAVDALSAGVGVGFFLYVSVFFCFLIAPEVMKAYEGRGGGARATGMLIGPLLWGLIFAVPATMAAMIGRDLLKRSNNIGSWLEQTGTAWKFFTGLMAALALAAGLHLSGLLMWLITLVALLIFSSF